MKIDFWYGDTLETIDGATVSFYPNDGVYRGNLYKNGRTVADFVSTDSTEIGKIFPGIFGE